MSKHTPAPWKLVHLEGGKRGSGEQFVIFADATPVRPIASGLPTGDERHVANLHLMAAAPELLEACEYALTAIIKFDEFPQVLKTTGQLVFATELKVKLKTAIAKATGESK